MAYKTSTAAVPFANATEGWVRVVHDVDNGAGGNDVKFYTSTDGIAWTQLGTTITTAGVTSIFPSTSRYSVGARGLGSSEAFAADSRIYEVQVRDGINGPSVVPYLPDAWEVINTGFPTFEGAPVLTWVMAEHPARDLAELPGALARVTYPQQIRPGYDRTDLTAP